jgi:hypothetical protein
MEKFLLILRNSGIDHKKNGFDAGHAGNPDLGEWIHSLTRSENYCSGVPVGPKGQNVAGYKMSKGKTSGDVDDRILRFDIIQAENIHQAVSIARGCPMVEQGLAEIELRTILTLIR